MKKTRRFAAMAAAMALAATMAVPMCAGFSASATNVSIDTSSDTADHTYTAYKIFAGAYNANGLTIAGWASGYDSEGLLADTDFTNLVITPAEDDSEAVTVSSFLGDKTDAASVAQAIEKLNINSNTSQADALATILQKHIGENQESTTLTDSATDIAAGYWIILDTYTADADSTDGNKKPDAVSKYVLRVSGGTEAIVVTPKKSYPTVVKKVQENTNVSDYTYNVGTTEVTDADYNDVADYNIGDAVPFKLYGTMPSTYGDYDHYYYLFTDTLGTQFDMPEESDIIVKVVNPDGDDEGDDADVTTLTTGYDISVDGNVIKVEFKDTKVISTITKDSVITVEYTAVLNTNAEIGLLGQENKVDLTYSNNPNNTGNGNDQPGDTDKTPEDKVIVFTYEVDINKVDGATGAKLADAEFVLSRGTDDDTEYAVVDSEGKISDWLKGTMVIAEDGTMTFTKTASKNNTSATTPTKLTTDANGKVVVIGLDDGSYNITEIKAPDSYNKLNSAVVVAVDATTDNGQSWVGTPETALTAFTYTVTGGDNKAAKDTTEIEENTTNGIAVAKISNDKGINLPSTGGIGTTLFVLGGGCAAALAGIYLVSKKRTKEEIAE